MFLDEIIRIDLLEIHDVQMDSKVANENVSSFKRKENNVHWWFR